jgi:hypothetical protein
MWDPILVPIALIIIFGYKIKDSINEIDDGGKLMYRMTKKEYLDERGQSVVETETERGNIGYYSSIIIIGMICITLIMVVG